MSESVSGHWFGVGSARRDVRLRGVAYLVLAVGTIGTLVSWVPSRGIDAERVEDLSTRSVTGRPDSDRSSAFPDRFESVEPAATTAVAEHAPAVPSPEETTLASAAKAIGDQKFDTAIQILNNERESLRSLPRAYLLMGAALEGRKDFVLARDFYNAATDRDPLYADAYWGIATSSEALGDLDAAVGAMRVFLHTVKDPDPYRRKVAQARSAIWEWEAQLGRGPWGPTKGVIPGLTAEQQKKDERGVALLMPLKETLRSDGSMRFEIKHQDKIEVYEKP